MANPLCGILWFLILIFISFFVAGFCAGWYILLHPLSVCIPPLSGITDLLLSGIQFPHTCAEGMMGCKPDINELLMKGIQFPHYCAVAMMEGRNVF